MTANSQALPAEIRGYKVHRATIEVHSSALPPIDKKTLDARIRLGEPRVIDVSLTGITFEVPIEASPVSVTGIIDFLTFSDFRVNGIPVEIEEYKGPIAFTKGNRFLLPRPASVFVNSGSVLQAAWSEFKGSKKDWVVTGRVFAFGKFKKIGLKFKRVVPIDIDVLIRNPFAGKVTASASSHP